MIRKSFNLDWTFYSAEKPEDKKVVQLPHDAMLYEKRIPRLKTGSFFGYFPSGDYYYEKSLYGAEAYADKTVILEFEGIYMDSHIFLNGEEVGGHVYGYSNFYVDLTGKLRIGEDNLIKVFVHNSQAPNNRWYTGSGIYRPVKLIVGNKSHIDLDGVKIITKSYAPAVLSVDVRAVCAEGCEILTEILDGDMVVGSGYGAHCEITMENAKLWDAEHPNLYRARVSLVRNGQTLDVDEQRIGIRKLEWSAESGLLVNGNCVKLRGGCIHASNGPIGAVSCKEAEYRRIRILKQAGYNAVRGAHDPRAKDFLDACDELGMYVIEEGFDVWFQGVGTYGYVLYFREKWDQDLTLMVEKCYNHPSVIMYSIGNEIAESNTAEGVAQAEKMVNLCHRLDDSRPVTMGLNLMLNVLNSIGIQTSAPGKKNLNKEDVVDPKSEEPDSSLAGSNLINMIVSIAGALTQILNRPKPADKASAGIFSKLDICGYNYGGASYEKHHQWHPERIMYGSESYPFKTYDLWQQVQKHPYVIGNFSWTGWDYYGESGIGIVEHGKKTGGFSKAYPALAAGCGTHDVTGFADSMAYYESVVWGIYPKPYIGVRHPKHYSQKTYYAMYRKTDTINSWSFDGWEGKPTQIVIFSQGSSVELWLNNKCIGKKAIKKCEAKFKAYYEPGVLEAISFDASGREIARSRVKTASRETIITAEPEKNEIRAGCEDLCYINVSLTDIEGICKPIERTIYVEVEGCGELLAVGSGAVVTEESNVGNHFTTHNGRMQTVIRSTKEAGEITVRFACEDLPPAEIKIVAV